MRLALFARYPPVRRSSSRTSASGGPRPGAGATSLANAALSHRLATQVRATRLGGQAGSAAASAAAGGNDRGMSVSAAAAGGEVAAASAVSAAAAGVTDMDMSASTSPAGGGSP